MHLKESYQAMKPNLKDRKIPSRRNVNIRARGYTERRYAPCHRQQRNRDNGIKKMSIEMIGMNLTGLSLSRPTILGTFQQTARSYFKKTKAAVQYTGVDDGSRTHLSSLEGWRTSRCTTSTYLDRF